MNALPPQAAGQRYACEGEEGFTLSHPESGPHRSAVLGRDGWARGGHVRRVTAHGMARRDGVTQAQPGAHKPGTPAAGDTDAGA